MRTQDFSPFARYAIGFDRIFDLLNNSSQIRESQGDYPPYNITRIGDETYRISLALPGWTPEQLTLTSQQNTLRISGQASTPNGYEYLHQGIVPRSFELQFSLEDHVEVEGATFVNGLLQVELIRRLPEVMKARRIPISGVANNKDAAQIKAA